MSVQTDRANMDLTEVDNLPSDWKILNFDKVVLSKRIKVGKLKQRSYKRIGLYPIVDQGKEFIAGYSVDKDKVYEGDLPVVIFGDHTRVLKLVDFPFIAGADGVKVIVPNTSLAEPKYLYYILQTLDIPSRGYNRHYSFLREKEIPLPPLPEQKAIAHILSTVQRAKEATEQVIQVTKELKKSLMKHLFTYGAVSLEEAPNVKLKETEIGMVTEGCEVGPISNIADLKMGQSPKGNTYNTVGNGVPLINGPAEFGTRFPRVFKYTSEPTKLCTDGDILICVRGNTTGRMNIADSVYCIGRGVSAIHGKAKQHYETSFLYYTLEKLQKVILDYAFSGGSTFPNITKSQLEQIRIPIFKPNERELIVKILQPLDLKLDVEINRLKALDQLFKTLLNNLMTGKIRVQNFEVPQA